MSEDLVIKAMSEMAAEKISSAAGPKTLSPSSHRMVEKTDSWLMPVITSFQLPFCSQYASDGWYEQLGGESSPLADAILDRIMFNSYKIPIVSADPNKSISMCELYDRKGM